MWKLRGLDRQLFEGAEAKIFEFLDIEPLMPPARLRFSKLLGRPLTEPIDCHCVAAVSLDEVRDMPCELGGQYGHAIRFYFGMLEPIPVLDTWRGPARDAPADLVGVCITTAEDIPFGDAWYATYKVQWPVIEVTDDCEEIIHPGLAHLCNRSEEFYKDWREQLDMRHDFANEHRTVYYRPTITRCSTCQADIRPQ